MKSRFDILFSIRIAHEALPFDPTAYDNAIERAFVIEPTAACRATMRGLGLIFKNTEGGALVIVEQVGEPLPSPLRKIMRTTPFTFLLKTKDSSILNKTKPYDSRPQTFLNGRKVLFFNNLDSNLQLDNRFQLTTSATVSASTA